MFMNINAHYRSRYCRGHVYTMRDSLNAIFRIKNLRSILLKFQMILEKDILSKCKIKFIH